MPTLLTTDITACTDDPPWSPDEAQIAAAAFLARLPERCGSVCSDHGCRIRRRRGRVVGVQVTVILSDPWDWDPPTLDLMISEDPSSRTWPKVARVVKCAVRADTDRTVHPAPEVFDESFMVGRRVSLVLRTQWPDGPPTILDEPTVYVGLDPDVPKRNLIGYGVLRPSPPVR